MTNSYLTAHEFLAPLWTLECLKSIGMVSDCGVHVNLPGYIHNGNYVPGSPKVPAHDLEVEVTESVTGSV